MTVRQMLDLIDSALRRRACAEAETELVIVTANGGCTVNLHVPVESAHPGGDWTAGLLVIVPAAALVLDRPLPAPALRVAEDRLSTITDRYKTQGLSYLPPRCRRDVWLCGYVGGVRARFTRDA